MLCQFRFKNFNSYRDEAVLDMQAANIEEFSDSLIPPPGGNFSTLLPASAIFGPNAGGKSNALNALAYCISRILTPIATSTDYVNPFGMFLQKYSPFLLDEDSRKAPTEFQLIFRTQHAQYQYNLSIFSNEVVKESLSYIKTPCERRRVTFLFAREHEQIELGSALKRANAQNVNSSIPYISFLSINYDFSEINDAIGWFKRCCIINFGIPNRDHRFSTLLEDEKIKPGILRLLSNMDIPVDNYEVREELDDDGEKKRRILTSHVVRGGTYQLDIGSESEGTLKILSALPGVVLSLASGGLLLVDELDAKLHPQLLRFLVKLYTTPEVNPHHAQIVFTCHDLSIMRNDVLRRDEIWFAAQNEDSASMLWSLYDIQDENGNRVKSTAAYDRQYLAGRYGADPYLKRILSWGDLDG